MQFKDRVVIVTGASEGIGEAVARLFSKRAAKVALVARSKKKLEKISGELPSSFVVTCDMSKKSEIQDMVKKVLKHYGRIDILVNNAGRGYRSEVEAIDPKKYRALFELNLSGPLIAMQCVFPIMKKQGKGYIVNVSSGTALMNIPGLAAYASLKRALVALSLTAREEFSKYKIGVSVIYPYITKTDFYKNGIGENENWGVDTRTEGLPPVDSPEFVATKLIEGIEKGRAEIFAHDWMKKASK